MRRLPVYLLLDTSGSMSGEAIEAVKNGMQIMINALRQNPQAMETAFISVITFNTVATQIIPLTDLPGFQMLDIRAEGVTALGDALKLLSSCIDKEVTKPTTQTKGDFKPLVFIMTDSYPTDDWAEGLKEFKKRKVAFTLACTPGGADTNILKQITDNVIRLDTTDSNTMGNIMGNIINWADRADNEFFPSSTLVEDSSKDVTGLNNYLKKIDMRRLPVYFLLDTSGSMNGEPIQALNNALSGMISNLRLDAQAVDSLWISIITFDREVKEIVPLTDLPSFQLPEIVCPPSGPTNTGKALELLYQKINIAVRKGTPTQKADWRPLLFIFTDGKPSDLLLYAEMIPKIKSLNLGAIVGCAAGNFADNSTLKKLTDTVVHLDTADSSTLKQFFKWVSDTIEQGNRSMGATITMTLPLPPSEVHLVI